MASDPSGTGGSTGSTGSAVARLAAVLAAAAGSEGIRETDRRRANWPNSSGWQASWKPRGRRHRSPSRAPARPTAPQTPAQPRTRHSRGRTAALQPPPSPPDADDGRVPLHLPTPQPPDARGRGGAPLLAPRPRCCTTRSRFSGRCAR